MNITLSFPPSLPPSFSLSQYTMDCVDDGEHSTTVPDMAQDDTPETIEVTSLSIRTSLK